MKRVLGVVLSALFAGGALAQITIGPEDAPAVGMSVTTYSTGTETFTPGSGNNQNWDISGFDYSPFNFNTYVDPAGTPFADTFPTATHCADASGSYAYFRAANNGLFYLGSAVTVDTFEIIQIPEEEVLTIPFPCTMNSAWSTVVYIEIEIFPGITTGSKDSTRNVVDSWGTLTTPDWSASALRVAGHSFFQIYANGVPQGSPTESWDYNWLTENGSRGATYSNFDATGPNFTTGEISYTTGGGSAVDPVRGPVAESFKLSQNYPNPFNPTTNLPLELAKSAKVELTIYNEMGQIVNHMNYDLSAGQHALPIDGSAWSTGNYFAKVVAGSEAQTTRMVLVK